MLGRSGRGEGQRPSEIGWGKDKVSIDQAKRGREHCGEGVLFCFLVEWWTWGAGGFAFYVLNFYVGRVEITDEGEQTNHVTNEADDIK